MSRSLSIRNHRRGFPVRLRLLTQCLDWVVDQRAQGVPCDLACHLVGAAEICRLNEIYLKHRGPTDIITFDYADDDELRGEIFICLDEAVSQARRYRTTWQRELARYLIHGVLHLTGLDDRRPMDRQRMKREEDKLLRQLEQVHSLERLQAPRTGSGGVRRGRP